MVDVNKPLENPSLKELFVRRKKARSAEEFHTIMNCLAEEVVMNAHFLSVIHLSEEPERQEDGKTLIKQGTTMGFAMLTAQDGMNFYPVFTDWEELGKWDSVKDTQPRTLIMEFDEYARMVVDQNSGNGIVINPFSDNLVLNRDLLSQWRELKQIAVNGHSECIIEKDTVVRIGEPKNVPEALISAISSCAEKLPEIRAVWLRLMEKSGELSYLVVVDFQGEQSAVFRKLADAGKPYLDGMYLDFVPYSDKSWQNAVENETAIYERKTLTFEV